MRGAFNAGVLSHYIVDPIMPFHTGSSKRENDLHRAVEWSICKSYDQIRGVIGGYPLIEAGRGPDWLAELVTAGAEISNGYYEALMDNYDFKRGAKNPPLG